MYLIRTGISKHCANKLNKYCQFGRSESSVLALFTGEEKFNFHFRIYNSFGSYIYP